MRHPLLQKFDLFNAPIAEHTRDADGLPRHNMIGAARSRMLHEVESGIAVVSDGVMSIGSRNGDIGSRNGKTAAPVLEYSADLDME